MEQNILDTIDYTDKKMKYEHKKISMCITAAGILVCICAFNMFPSESSWGEIYSIAGLLLIVTGMFRELKFSSFWRKRDDFYCRIFCAFRNFLCRGLYWSGAV